jgi:NTP pyrophosphatase (non-canonical NTP hydrolase)
MDLDKYQKHTQRTAQYSYASEKGVRTKDLVYPVLGLNGEAGEVAEKLKRLVRANKRYVSDEERAAIALELGDILWYVAQSALRMRYKLSEIAHLNIEKLQSRRRRNKVLGSGDNR